MESIVNHIVIRLSTRYVTDLTEIVHMAALTDLEESVVTQQVYQQTVQLTCPKMYHYK